MNSHSEPTTTLRRYLSDQPIPCYRCGQQIPAMSWFVTADTMGVHYPSCPSTWTPTILEGEGRDSSQRSLPMLRLVRQPAIDTGGR